MDWWITAAPRPTEMNWGWVSELTGDLALFAVDSYKFVAVMSPKLKFGSSGDGQEDDVVIVYNNNGPGVGVWKNAWELLPWGWGLGGGEGSILPWGSVGNVLWWFRWGVPYRSACNTPISNTSVGSTFSGFYFFANSDSKGISLRFLIYTYILI